MRVLDIRSYDAMGSYIYIYMLAPVWLCTLQKTYLQFAFAEHGVNTDVFQRYKYACTHRCCPVWIGTTKIYEDKATLCKLKAASAREATLWWAIHIVTDGMALPVACHVALWRHSRDCLKRRKGKRTTKIFRECLRGALRIAQRQQFSTLRKSCRSHSEARNLRLECRRILRILAVPLNEGTM